MTSHSEDVLRKYQARGYIKELELSENEITFLFYCRKQKEVTRATLVGASDLYKAAQDFINNLKLIL